MQDRETFLSGKFHLVSWENAKQVLLKGKFESSKKYRSGWITFRMKRDGRNYLTKPPKMEVMDDFIKNSELADEG